MESFFSFTTKKKPKKKVKAKKSVSSSRKIISYDIDVTSPKSSEYIPQSCNSVDFFSRISASVPSKPIESDITISSDKFIHSDISLPIKELPDLNSNFKGIVAGIGTIASSIIPRRRLIYFSYEKRPPYYGSFSIQGTSCIPLLPLSIESGIDYDEDSDGQWEKDREGDEEEDIDEEQEILNDPELMAMIVPDGYLSESEVENDSDLDLSDPGSQSLIIDDTMDDHPDDRRLRRPSIEGIEKAEKKQQSSSRMASSTGSSSIGGTSMMADKRSMMQNYYQGKKVFRTPLEQLVRKGGMNLVFGEGLKQSGKEEIRQRVLSSFGVTFTQLGKRRLCDYKLIVPPDVDNVSAIVSMPHITKEEAEIILKPELEEEEIPHQGEVEETGMSMDVSQPIEKKEGLIDTKDESH
ncbi:Chromatin assembly factor 1 subunit A like protein [Aduncisulcus paluster]|uniref:Chromatin assembly factor 1 subunit A like protein n=1 Tax=Aduncisulcus paluster TaxID=2918883 RepID=A0ABQ5KS48_9EUKA|nr:Chromatin assembly factor 1 subunit A like protein [Aduncisulcus paluster]